MHGFWDTQFVDAIATPPGALADQLLARIMPEEARTWAKGTPADWAMEAFAISKADVYGNPPRTTDHVQDLDADYVSTAEVDVRLQLSRAGIRLASVLNAALGSKETDWNTCLRH